MIDIILPHGHGYFLFFLVLQLYNTVIIHYWGEIFKAYVFLNKSDFVDLTYRFTLS